LGHEKRKKTTQEETANEGGRGKGAYLERQGRNLGEPYRLRKTYWGFAIDNIQQNSEKKNRGKRILEEKGE